MLSKKLKMIAISALVVTSITSFSATKTKAYTGIHSTTSFNTRLGGKDRYDTNIAIADEFTKNNKTDTAILASSIDYPDSLSSAPLTKIYNAPILLTEKNKLTPRIETEMKKLGIKHVIIVGGTGVISDTVNKRLQAIGMTTERLSGSDRYATSLAIASRVAQKVIDKNGKLENLLVATSNYTDVLSLAPVSCGLNAPILLVKADAKKISDVAGLQDFINKYVPKDLSKNDYTTYATNTTLDLQLALPANASGGGSSDLDKDKYLSNLSINNAFTSILDSSTFVIANGQNFPDALGGAALAGKLQAPILFVGTDKRKTFRIKSANTDDVLTVNANYWEKEFLSEYKQKGAGVGVYLLGGTGVVANNAVSDFR
ncbi:MAG: cell wall-binding repeat-containing protein [Clostridium tyrobutyricum]|jgi:putative cell wall-binding protein|uniref:cell wall-binding repeat-containing protein n=1 Tax=Clostridium tyrobutyricum TaxID=1519 RepID=UPI00242D9FDA|nr:cell wall-binding repeat-containing protein [Clostridium tyrobutyricum]MCH4200565.1 cell wall-binding repeat-containing protein [Clostridium tyrobutyricum]MCH4237588.1 cell wall-binding repeat-containing protein [Clostridium tyrobutyricum]MCH4259701.1 cell wall-binding repeat-containing protein [Clostridium tyrobutyricum]